MEVTNIIPVGSDFWNWIILFKHGFGSKLIRNCYINKSLFRWKSCFNNIFPRKMIYSRILYDLGKYPRPHTHTRKNKQMKNRRGAQKDSEVARKNIPRRATIFCAARKKYSKGAAPQKVRARRAKKHKAVVFTNLAEAYI